MTSIELTVNGEKRSAEADPRLHLADFLRETMQLTATHVRCEQGVCGVCTILIDGVPARSCITYAVQCQDAEITTLEGLKDDHLMIELRKAFTADHGLQCGFCTPAMLITARDIALRLPDADEARVRQEISGNLCRCTGYAGIVRAIHRVLAARAGTCEERPSGAQSRLGPAGSRPTELTAPVANTLSPARDATQASERAFDTGELGLGKHKANLETSLAFTVNRPLDEVWSVLADVERIARCMPGASLTEPPVDGRIRGTVAIKVGPIATKFGGTGLIVRDEIQRKGVIYGAARDALSGSSTRAEVAYALEDAEDGATRVDLNIRALLAGPLAQFGRSGIVKDLVARIAAEFAQRLERSLVSGDESFDDMPSFNPAMLFLSVIQARIKLALGRIFGSRS